MLQQPSAELFVLGITGSQVPPASQIMSVHLKLSMVFMLGVSCWFLAARRGPNSRVYLQRSSLEPQGSQICVNKPAKQNRIFPTHCAVPSGFQALLQRAENLILSWDLRVQVGLCWHLVGSSFSSMHCRTFKRRLVFEDTFYKAQLDVSMCHVLW